MEVARQSSCIMQIKYGLVKNKWYKVFRTPWYRYQTKSNKKDVFICIVLVGVTQDTNRSWRREDRYSSIEAGPWRQIRNVPTKCLRSPRRGDRHKEKENPLKMPRPRCTASAGPLAFLMFLAAFPSSTF